MSNHIELTDDQLKVLTAPVRLGFTAKNTVYCGGPLKDFPKTPVLVELCDLGYLEPASPMPFDVFIELGESAYTLTEMGESFLKEYI